MHHEQYMRRCLDLARMAYPACRPNPMVGALLVHDGKIVGEGCTQRYGHSHAEVMAIADAPDELLSKSTLYVSLEPCVHFGKTPPCADLVIEKNIPRVVVACSDPFPAVDGRGVERLKAAGVEVLEGVLEQEAKKVNKRFFTYHEKKRPYVILKWAESKDGFIDMERSAGRPMKISSVQSNQLVHSWRAEEQAILIGGRTARLDSPRLDVRLVSGQDPERFVWTSSGLPLESPLAQKGYTRIEASTVDEVLAFLYEKGVQSVFLEGGAMVNQQFIDTQNYDEVRRIISQIELGGGLSAPRIVGESIRQEMSGGDQIHFYES